MSPGPEARSGTSPSVAQSEGPVRSLELLGGDRCKPGCATHGHDFDALTFEVASQPVSQGEDSVAIALTLNQDYRVRSHRLSITRCQRALL